MDDRTTRSSNGSSKPAKSGGSRSKPQAKRRSRNLLDRLPLAGGFSLPKPRGKRAKED